jgi:prevent-host-death family protein
VKSLQVSEDILPLGVFKARASQVLRKLREGQRPLVITQHGKPVAVLLTPAEFDRLAAYDRFLAAVQEGMADSEAGRVVTDQALTSELNAAFPPLEQS